MKDNSKLSDVNWIRVILVLMLIVLSVSLSSCSYNITPRQAQINYELDRAYLEYSYQRDSLFIEYNKRVLINKE